jgi:hypothetical protein
MVIAVCLTQSHLMQSASNHDGVAAVFVAISLGESFRLFRCFNANAAIRLTCSPLDTRRLALMIALRQSGADVGSEMGIERLEDYSENPSYERRVVVFYDVLGWRARIAEAGTDPVKIGELRRIILGSTRITRLSAEDFSESDIRISSFSDNIVVSVPVSQLGLYQLLGSVGCLVLAAASNGFLVRGGVTIGDVVHDSECVFGPGLNRAYELESTVAKLPRVVIDEVVLMDVDKLPFFVQRDDGILYIDPFTREFMKLSASMEEPIAKESQERSGLPITDDGLFYSKVAPREILRTCLEGLKPYLKKPLADKDHDRFAWLYDRVAKQLGVPPASSYPRIKV